MESPLKRLRQEPPLLSPSPDRKAFQTLLYSALKESGYRFLPFLDAVKMTIRRFVEGDMCPDSYETVQTWIVLSKGKLVEKTFKDYVKTIQNKWTRDSYSYYLEDCPALYDLRLDSFYEIWDLEWGRDAMDRKDWVCGASGIICEHELAPTNYPIPILPSHPLLGEGIEEDVEKRVLFKRTLWKAGEGVYLENKELASSLEGEMKEVEVIYSSRLDKYFPLESMVEGMGAKNFSTRLFPDFDRNRPLHVLRLKV